MKQKYLWLTVPLALLLTACNTTAHQQTNNAATANGSNQVNKNGQAANTSNAPANHTANSTVKNATRDLSTPILATQVSVTADTYTAKPQNVVYPELHGLPNITVQNKLNALLKKTAIYVPTKTYSKPDSYTYTSSYNVVFEQGDIINIVYLSYFFPTGAAHGMLAHTSLILNLKTGQTYSVNDLFQPKSNYLQEISRAVENADKKHILDTFIKKFTGVTSKDTMFLREGGFVVDFAPYEWASFAQGFLDYYVPFSSVKSVVDEKSSMWRALNDTTGFPATNYRNEEAAKISSLGYTVSLSPEDETTVITGKGDTLTAWAGNKKTANVPDSNSTYIFFFLNGKYLGTDTSNPHSHSYIDNIYPDKSGTIAVTYDYYSSTGANKTFTIHYHWNGSKLAAKGSFPSGFGTSKS